MVDMEIDLNDAREYIEYRLKGLRNQNVEKVLQRSLKRAVTAYQTAVIKETKKQYILKDKDLKSNMKITPSGNGYQFSTISRSKLVVYYDYGTVSGKTGKKKNNFKVGERQYYGARVYKKNKLKHIVNSFWVSSNQSGKGVLLKRLEGLKGKSARKVKNWLVVGPAVAKIVANEQTQQQAKNRAMEILQNRIDHEIDRILQSGG